MVGVRVAYIRWIAAGEKKFKLEEDLLDVNGEGGFTITGLSPGSYYLQAVPDRISINGRAHAAEDFALTFYPNSLDLAGAGTLTNRRGGRGKSAIWKIRMRKSPKFRVRGKVSSPAGAAGVPTQLDLISEDSAEMSFGAGKSASIANGEFEFEGVQPGSYILRSGVSVQSGNMQNGEFSWGSAHYFSRQVLEVSDRDVTDLTVTFARPPSTSPASFTPTG